jgi:hypothetical protein
MEYIYAYVQDVPYVVAPKALRKRVYDAMYELSRVGRNQQ